MDECGFWVAPQVSNIWTPNHGCHQAVAALNLVRSTASFFSAARAQDAPIDEGMGLNVLGLLGM